MPGRAGCGAGSSGRIAASSRPITEPRSASARASCAWSSRCAASVRRCRTRAGRSLLRHRLLDNRPAGSRPPGSLRETHSTVSYAGVPASGVDPSHRPVQMPRPRPMPAIRQPRGRYPWSHGPCGWRKWLAARRRRTKRVAPGVGWGAGVGRHLCKLISGPNSPLVDAFGQI